MRNLRAAIVFLTRVPVPVSGDMSPTAAVPWYPVVGALVGLAVGGVAAGLLHVVPPLVAAAVAVTIGVLITGAFHEDGLADVADAFVGGWTRADRMRILKDPLHGSYGVAALCLSVVVRVACLASFGVSPAVALACAVAAHTLARAAAVSLMATARAVSTDGLGAGATHALSKGRATLGTLAGLAIAALATGWWVVPFAAAAVLGATAIGWWAIRKIECITGDVLGAAEQVVECLVLAVATGLASRYTLWWVR